MRTGDQARSLGEITVGRGTGRVKGLGRGNETGGVSGLKVPCALAAGDDGGRARGGGKTGGRGPV